MAATASDTTNLHNDSISLNKVKKKAADMEFSLTEDEMKKIHYLGRLERKKHRSKGVKELKQSKFSDALSLEAQIAMQMALKDTQAMKRHDAIGAASVVSMRNRVKFADEQTTPELPARPDTQCSKHSSFSETFEKRGSVRMDSDITDEQFEASIASKRSLDGTKLQNALETVEIVNHDAERHVVDDDVIEQIAQRNSVEKCLVWMEVLAKEGQIPEGEKTHPKEGQIPEGKKTHPKEGQIPRGKTPQPKEGQLPKGKAPHPKEGQIPKGKNPQPKEGQLLKGKTPHPQQQLTKSARSHRTQQTPYTANT